MKDNEQKIKAVPLLRGPRTCEAVTGAAQLSIQPRFLTKANALAVSGASLRWWCEHYPHLVRHVGKKRVIVVAELERAVSTGGADGETPTIGDIGTSVDPAEAVRSILRRAGAR